MTASARPALARPALARPALALTVLATAVLTACSPTDPAPGPGPATQTRAPAEPTQPTEPDADADADGASQGERAPVPVDASHVHGLGLDEAGAVLVGTHEGVLRFAGEGSDALTGQVVGPAVDLMGFSVVASDLVYASGHPGPGVDLPNPVGLLRSADGGETWTSLSRAGESDFHALTASEAAVVGFDGRGLWRTEDGAAWEELAIPTAPYALTMSEDGATLLATTQQGPMRSTDGGRRWDSVEGPLLMLVAWAGGSTVVGVTPDGVVAVSEDGGATWAERGSVGPAPQGLAARMIDGGLAIVAVAGNQLVESEDDGATFVPYDGL